MALALGGATLTWWLFRRPSVEKPISLDVAAAYERGFWAATGVLVMTGVGNLGSFAPAVPTVDTYWGTVFAVKLLAVIAILALSLVRTLAVHRCRRAETTSADAIAVLRIGYGATALAFVAVVALGEVLAHG
jgi:putative copper export protein